MSGPIVRKYGFPNFEKIFGERPLIHGVEEDAPAPVEQPGRAEAIVASEKKKGKPRGKSAKKAKSEEG